MQRFIFTRQPLGLIRSRLQSVSTFRLLSTTAICQRTGGPNHSHHPLRHGGSHNHIIHPPAHTPKPSIYAVDKELKTKLRNFQDRDFFKKKATAFGIKGKQFNELALSFSKAALAGEIPRCSAEKVYEAVTEGKGHASVDKILLYSFFSYAEAFVSKEMAEKISSLKKISDLRFPSEWFPEARQMQRKIILHVGPTNSGKTYRALQRLEEAESGIYCGPLRLLAHEIFDKMNAKGIPCNLLTGEERRIVAPHANLTSSTVEMASLNKTLDVAVIDEIQMIGDPDRGWAWTQALLGLKAKEIHLCGEEAAVPLIKRICETLDEEVIVNEYSRLTPYTVCDKPLGDLSNIKKGDCVVAFSRRAIFENKNKIELKTGLKCAVAYGALPPESRALQAKAFNDPDSGFDVLVASDAVGMGLNLNIKRMIFSEIIKFNGRAMTYVSIPQLKQIAGRAGRFGTAYADGEVTAISKSDLDYVKEAVNQPNPELGMAGLQPTVDILELFALQSPHEPFAKLLQKFEDLALLQGNYFLCNYDAQKVIAEAIEKIKLPLRDRYQFVTAPVNTRNEHTLSMIVLLAKKFSNSQPCELSEVLDLPEESEDPPSLAALPMLETNHKHIMLYMWLSIRYPDIFKTEQEEAFKIKMRCEAMIDEILKTLSPKSKAMKLKTHKGKKMHTKKLKQL